MLKINENDFLWKCYKRYYKSNPWDMQKSGNMFLCSFFWKAVGGMLAWFMWDLSAFIAGPLLGLTLGLFIYWSIQLGSWSANHPTFLNVFSVGATFINGALLLILVISRYVEYWKDKPNGEKVLIGSFLLFLYAVFSFVSTAFWQNILYGIEDKGVHWSAVIFGLMSPGVIGLLIYFCFHFFSEKDNPTKNVVQAYAKSIKSKVCPLISLPSIQEDKKNDKTA